MPSQPTQFSNPTGNAWESIGGANADFMLITMSGNQAVSVNDAVDFDTIDQSGVAASRISLGASGLLTVQPGRYRLTAAIRLVGVGADTTCQWFNVTGGAAFGSRSTVSVDSTTLSNQPTAVGFLDVSVETEVELRVLGAGGSPTIFAIGTHAVITFLG